MTCTLLEYTQRLTYNEFVTVIALLLKLGLKKVIITRCVPKSRRTVPLLNRAMLYPDKYWQI